MDIPSFWKACVSVLNQQTSIQVVGEASDGMEAIEKAVSLDPDVVMMDLRMPRVDGLTVLRSIHTRAPRSKVILFLGRRQQR